MKMKIILIHVLQYYIDYSYNKQISIDKLMKMKIIPIISK
jgi:hypothetical protein